MIMDALADHTVLQQYLPFTVLKLAAIDLTDFMIVPVAIVLTVYGIETRFHLPLRKKEIIRCNSTYRLRY